MIPSSLFIQPFSSSFHNPNYSLCVNDNRKITKQNKLILEKASRQCFTSPILTPKVTNHKRKLLPNLIPEKKRWGPQWQQYKPTPTPGSNPHQI